MNMNMPTSIYSLIYAYLDYFLPCPCFMLYLLISVFMLSLAKQTQDTPSALDNIAAYVQNELHSKAD